MTAGLVAHPFAVARDVLRFYRDLTASLPDELSVFAGLCMPPMARAPSSPRWSRATRGAWRPDSE